MSRKERRAAAKLERQAARVETGATGLFRMALQHHQAGQVGEAEALYRRVLIVQPDHADACFNLATALKQWMGVPVVTLIGDRHASRVGASLFTQAGLQDWIATTIDDYVAIASAFAENPQQLCELRGALRGRMTGASLCDANDFARRVEASYRVMWQRWCETANR